MRRIRTIAGTVAHRGAYHFVEFCSDTEEEITVDFIYFHTPGAVEHFMGWAPGAWLHQVALVDTYPRVFHDSGAGIGLWPEAVRFRWRW